jgi:GTP 3',8-cyclase
VRYEVNEGRITTWALETHIVDHCNLRCANCCTGSPALPERFVDVDAFADDLARARAVLAPSVFKLTGGEPTLHPRLDELVDIARASGIAPVISVTSNGLLAGRLSDHFWRGIDRMTLSLYTSAPLPTHTHALVRARCAEHRVQLVEKAIDRFQVLDASAVQDDATTSRIFAGCWLRHRCHMLAHGRFHACTRLGRDEGVALELGALLAYLERDEPHARCSTCLGASGPWQEHRQLAHIRTRTAPA